MNLPNAITFGRLFLVPLTVYAILEGRLDWACALFFLAGVSDAADGIAARVLQARTVLGSFLDPLADKALLVSVYLSLAKIGLLPLWLVILVVSRDVMIIGGVLLLYTMRHAPRMQPLLISKANTAVQLTLVVLVLAEHGLSLRLPTVAGGEITAGLTWAAAATTLWSGAAYVRQCLKVVSEQPGAP